jgi:hypothetical protein
MKAFFGAASRLIFPLLARFASVDFFGTDEVGFFAEDFARLAELLFDFIDVLFEDERVVEAWPFCAVSAAGNARTATRNAIWMRVSIRPPVVVSGGDYRPWMRGKVKKMWTAPTASAESAGINAYAALCASAGHRGILFSPFAFPPREETMSPEELNRKLEFILDRLPPARPETT